jgi:hypothetical protein
VETVDSFTDAFRTLGYEVCSDSAHEVGYERVAIYVDPGGTPTHMARQLSTGFWTSKIGKLEDIEHETLHGLEETDYGQVVRVLKRRLVKPRQAFLFSALEWVFRRIVPS